MTRWGGGLPQYAVGHVERIARVRAAVAAVPGLAVCGAAFDGARHPGLHRLGPARCRPVWENDGMVDGKRARELNDSIRYTAWSVFKVARPARRGRPQRRW